LAIITINMYSIGTDIVNVERIKKLLNDNGEKFINKVYTENELQYCNANSEPHIHFSGKYAAKEAVKKALLSKNLIENISLKKIEILNNKNKSPYVKIDDLDNININITISHESEYAVAFALIEK